MEVKWLTRGIPPHPLVKVYYSSYKEDIMSKKRGTVKWFNDSKGFGFITPEEGGKDLFVHHTNIVSEGFRSLSEGQQVEFEVGQGPKGEHATQVTAV